MEKNRFEREYKRYRNHGILLCLVALAMYITIVAEIVMLGSINWFCVAVMVFDAGCAFDYVRKASWQKKKAESVC